MLHEVTADCVNLTEQGKAMALKEDSPFSNNIKRLQEINVKRQVPTLNAQY